MAKAAGLHVVWFKRDLRIVDHAPLTEAARCGPVLPLYIVELDLWAQPDTAGRHWAFIAESLEELRNDLGRLGLPLVVRVGDAVDVLTTLHDMEGIVGLWSHEETGNGWTYTRDRAVAGWVRAHGIPWRQHRQNGVIRRLANRDGWAKAWDAFMAFPAITPPPFTVSGSLHLEESRIPQAADLGLAPDPCPGRQRGGRSEAMRLLESFLGERGIDYRRTMSSPVTGEWGCSRLSPHLALGTVSIREVAQAAWVRMRELKADRSPDAKQWRASLISFNGRLHWHCHFMQKLESEPRIEFENFHKAYDGLRPGAPDPMLLTAWATGKTGFPFVDACMRSLAQTGWINFRMRAMLMAFASYHLWQPWRHSGLVLARLFTDYEPGIHWSQSQMQSGTTGINTVRIYNPVKQGYDQDPEGTFVRRYVPELGSVPDEFLQEPWLWSGFSTVEGKLYPHRIVDHLAAAKSASKKVWGVRRSEVFRDGADAIQEKHGSRKSGMPNTGVRRRKAVAPAAPSQLTFDIDEP